MFSAARRFTSSSSLASVYKAQNTKALFSKSTKFSQHSNNSQHQLMSHVGVVQKAFSHDVNINIQFGFENQQQVLDLLKEQGGKVEQTNKSTVTYFDSVPQEEVAPEAAEVAKQRQSFEKYSMTSKDTWLFKITTSDSATWKCIYPTSEEGRTHLDKPVVERAPAFNTANGEREIRRFLNLQQDMTAEARTNKKLPTLDEDLRSRLGVVPFAKYDVTETVLSVSPLINYATISVTLKEASFGYKLGSLSCNVQNVNEEMAHDLAIHLLRILKSTKLEKLQTPNMRTIIQEFLYRNRQATHYKALLDAGIRDDRLMDPAYAEEALNASLEKRGLTPPAEEEEEESK